MAWSRRVLGAGDARVSSAPWHAKNYEEEHYDYYSTDLSSVAQQLPEAKEPERIVADAKVVALLAQDEFSGRRWDVFLERLVEYAFPIIRSWIASGRIFRQGAELSPHYPTGVAISDLWDDDTVDDLTQETLYYALPAFRRALMEGKWEEGRGASLATYFVGMCILQFANAYKYRLKRTDLQPRLLGAGADLADEMDRLQASGADVAHAVVQRVFVEQFLQEMRDPQLRLVLLLRLQGYSYREAAERAGLTPKAAESRLARYRKNLLRDDALREWVETHLHI